MNATQKFIEDAIKGGWKDLDKYDSVRWRYVESDEAHLPDGICFSWTVKTIPYLQTSSIRTTLFEILLDPLAWQAVGKTRGWSMELYSPCSAIDAREEWEARWHNFIDHHADGLSIEDSLQALE